MIHNEEEVTYVAMKGGTRQKDKDMKVNVRRGRTGKC